MNSDPASQASRSMLDLLLRVKAKSMYNRVYKATTEAPLRVFSTSVMVALIWYGLYRLFLLVFEQLKTTPLEATVAIPLLFNFFFMAMLTLLTFSNAIVVYGALFGKNESAYLLTSPINPLDVVTFKFLESLLTASWSLVLLGIPLMLAMADWADDRWFYVLFIAFFLAFLPIPTALGLAIAWCTARFIQHQTRRSLTTMAAVVAAAVAIWILRSMQRDNTAPEIWLQRFYDRMNLLESAFLPNHWIAQGIDHALHGDFSVSLLYLCVTVSSAFFISWVVVRAVAKRLDGALDRASTGRGTMARTAASVSGGFAGWMFAYLPRELRLIAAKDLRTFLRDPLQWSQLAILFGLLTLYLSNIPTLRQQITGYHWAYLIPFFNLCSLSLILATFTCRFVYPLISLEGHQLWLVGLLPIPRGRILRAKFAFAMTVTVCVAVSAMSLAIAVLRPDPVWALIHIGMILSVCVGLCGFSVGIGARFPMFDELNPARIANGLGGTINLLASVTLVTFVLTGIGVATLRSREATPDLQSIGLCFSSSVICIAAGLAALAAGERHFDKIEV